MNIQGVEHNDKLALDYLFHPQSIAIAGVSGDSAGFSGGLNYMQSLLNIGFEGKLYPIHPNGGEVFNRKIYPSIEDIPGSVDYVISAISARNSAQLVADCAAKGVKAIHFFTAGFGEIEDDEGKQLESELLDAVRQSDIRIIGPNGMGIYCPNAHLSYGLDLPKESGSVGFFAQSGVNSTFCIMEGTGRNVYFSKVVSYGNASDLNESDFLEYFTYDPETKIIAAYIEGIRDGPRFAKTLKEATKIKPVILLKAGTSESGARAIASHTSSIAGSNIIWESVIRQAGAIQVQSIEEMIDVSVTFLRMPRPKGRNTAIVGLGGGPGAMGADHCSNEGLVIPMLPPQVRQRLKDIYQSDTGLGFKNPVDIYPFIGSEVFVNAIKVVADYDHIDLLIIHVPFDIWVLSERKYPTQVSIDSIIAAKNVLNKPVAAVLYSHVLDEGKELAAEAYARLCEAEVPVYPSFRRAASAINKLIGYYEWHERNQENNS